MYTVALAPFRAGAFVCLEMVACYVFERWNEWFYQGAMWEGVRNLYADSVYGLCERCGKPGDIVHHRQHLTPDNIHDKAIAYGFENLELLCLACHNEEHFGISATADGLYFDENGDLVERGPPEGSKKNFGEGSGRKYARKRASRAQGGCGQIMPRR